MHTREPWRACSHRRIRGATVETPRAFPGSGPSRVGGARRIRRRDAAAGVRATSARRRVLHRDRRRVPLLRRRAPRPAACAGAARAVLVIAALVQAIPLASPLLLSQDAGAYWDYARIAAVDGGNPYSDPPLRFRADPAYPSVAGAWRKTTSAYGPLFTAASEGGALVVGASPSAARSLFKTAAAVGVVALALLAALVSPRPAFAAAAVGWNPLFAMHFGGGGHNDVWMMVPLVGALALDRRGRRHLAGALWAVAVAVKWIPLLLLPLRTSVRQHSPRFGYAGFAVASFAVAAVASILYGSKWLGALGRSATTWPAGRRRASPICSGGRYREGARLGCARARLRHRLRRARRRCTEAARAARPRDRVPVAGDTVDSALVRELGGATRRRRGRCRRLVLSVALTGYLLEARAPL